MAVRRSSTVIYTNSVVVHTRLQVRGDIAEMRIPAPEGYDINTGRVLELSGLSEGVLKDPMS